MANEANPFLSPQIVHRLIIKLKNASFLHLTPLCRKGRALWERQTLVYSVEAEAGEQAGSI